MEMVLRMLSYGRTLSSQRQSNLAMESLEAQSCIINYLQPSVAHLHTRVRYDQFPFTNNNSMLSEQQIRSFIRLEGEQVQAEGEPLLDLSHKQLRRLKQIELASLKVGRVDASYNYFKSFNDLNFREVNHKTAMPVSWLDISFNYFTSIDESAESAHVLQYLKHLNISANRLESVDFSQLKVPLLEVLNLSSNQLQFFLDCPGSLRVLTLDHNRLSSLAFKGGENLSVLSARNNIIKRLGVSLPQLLLLDLESNLVEELEAVRQLVGHSPELLSINMRENPVTAINSYRLMLLEHCNAITQIDEVAISPHIREGYKVLKSEQKLDEMLEQANRKYADRLAQKQKIKEELLKKMQEQQKLIEARFQQGVREERGQFEELEKHAKQILAKKKLNITEEQNQFGSKLNQYSQQQEEEAELEEEKLGQVQDQHMKEYLQFLKKRASKSSQQKVRRKRMSNMLNGVEIREELRGIVMMDLKCIPSLLQDYYVDQIDL